MGYRFTGWALPGMFLVPPPLIWAFSSFSSHIQKTTAPQAPQAWCSAQAAPPWPEAGLQHLPSPGGTQHSHSPKPRRALLVGSTHTVLICKLSQPDCNGFVDATQLTSPISWGFSLSFGQFWQEFNFPCPRTHPAVLSLSTSISSQKSPQHHVSPALSRKHPSPHNYQPKAVPAFPGHSPEAYSPVNPGSPLSRGLQG